LVSYLTLRESQDGEGIKDFIGDLDATNRCYTSGLKKVRSLEQQLQVAFWIIMQGFGSGDWEAFDSAKNHKRQRRKRQSVTIQPRKVANAKIRIG